MKSYKNIFACMFLLFSFLAYSQSNAKIKITSDPENRIYKVFFASESDYATVVTLEKNSTGEVVINETVRGKGFMKMYSLKDAPVGNYTWTLKYGSDVYTEEIQIVSANQTKKTRKSIEVNFDELLNLTIDVDPSNRVPLNIFLYNGLGEQLKYIFWEPKSGDYQKVINFANLDAYDIKVEILQGGDPIFTETYSTY